MKELAGSIFYMAPEVLGCKAYNEKCDMWSCGVLMYLILCGRPPFLGKTREEMLNEALKGRVDFNLPIWRTVSEDAKKLIQKLLMFDQQKRITALCALKHSWIQRRSKPSAVKAEEVSQAIDNLKHFCVSITLQQAVLSYLASQEMSPEEEIQIRKIFSFLDQDQDGLLTKSDLISSLASLYKDTPKAMKDADQILRHLGFSHSSLGIGYNEFLVANLSYKESLTEEKLKKAFKFFDESNKGFIESSDLGRVFGSSYSIQKLEEILEEADKDGDHRISLIDFISMMDNYKMERINMFHFKTQSNILYIN